MTQQLKPVYETWAIQTHYTLGSWGGTNGKKEPVGVINPAKLEKGELLADR